ncbi:MAG: methylmalonyl-CoA mutase, partial [Beijerinckiaceae bacterium]|nr:methylmalonyl-CoA mutase [Beijerinckiaceae bacterium]
AASRAAVACLCGTNAAYAADAAALVTALRERGAHRILAAGRPADGAETNVDAFVHDGCDALDVLRTTLDVIEAAASRA